MQAKLPDINAALVRYRSLAIESFQNNDDATAKVALGNMVALLPDKFKVKVDTFTYQEKIKEKHLIICPKCNHENPITDIRYVKRLLSQDEQFAKAMKYLNKLLTIEDKEYEWVWHCLKCKKENFRSESKRVTIEPDLPYYLGVIPEAPEKPQHWANRGAYPAAFRNWFQIAFQEIESKIGIYRAEYIAQNADHADDFGKDEK